jgi:uncharacterized protein (TIGR00730 family)
MNICLYGASSPALDRAYFDAAEEFGRLLAKNGHTLVYGGGAQGVMGAAARGAADAGGKITGIAPNFLNVDGILFDRCTEFILTDTMAERKAAMIAHADAFVMAPGGFFVFGCMIALINKISKGKAIKKKEFGCAGCPGCGKGACEGKEAAAK